MRFDQAVNKVKHDDAEAAAKEEWLNWTRSVDKADRMRDLKQNKFHKDKSKRRAKRKRTGR